MAEHKPTDQRVFRWWWFLAGLVTAFGLANIALQILILAG